MQRTVHIWRIVAATLGFGAASLGCYGAYEYALKLEGGTLSYLVIAGPVVAMAAALIPPLAEAMWRSKEYVKCLAWWLALVPAVAVVFFSAAERVHMAKAGAAAELTSLSKAASRAEQDLADAKAAHKAAKAKADETRKWKKCGPSCLGIRETETARFNDVQAAEAALLKAQSLSTEDAPIKAPVWLLPAALDVVAFMAIWTGFAGPWIERRPAPSPEPVKAPVKIKRKRKQVQPAGPKAMKLRSLPKLVANN